MKQMISTTINGKVHQDAIEDNLLLIDYLRETRSLKGTKSGCDGGECGACTVLINGEPKLSCITLAATCQDTEIQTIEGEAIDGKLSILQRAFHENLGTQCGFCTPGMIMAAKGLLSKNPTPCNAEIEAALAGNLCRCTGYVKIIKSVRLASEALS